MKLMSLNFRMHKKKTGTKGKLKKQVMIMVIGVIFMTMIVSTGVSIYNLVKIVDKAAAGKTQDSIVAFKNEIDLAKQDALVFGQMIASNTDVVKATESKDSELLLSTLNSIKKVSGVEIITFTDEKGQVLARAHDPSRKGDVISSEKSISLALKGESISLIDSGTSSKLSVRAGVPVKNAKGEMIGVVSTGYDISSNDMVDKIKSMFGTDATIFLGDTRASTTIKKDGNRVVNTKMDAAIAELVLKNGKAYEGKADIQGMQYTTKYQPLLDSDNKPMGAIFTGMPLSDLVQTRNKIIIAVALAGVLVMTASVLVIVGFMRRKIEKPLAYALDALDKVSTGDLRVEIEDKMIVDDEIGHMLYAIRNMITGLRGLAHEMMNMSESVAGSSEEMTASSDEISKVAEQIAMAVSDIAKGATEQAASAERGSESITEVIQGLENISEDMTESDQMAENAQHSVENGRKSVEVQELKMDETKKVTSDVTTAILSLSEKSTEIGQILEAINDIAEQTNLLSLNAAIEAARAGEHGRGFSVVADSIRKLAEQSSQSVKRIDSIVGEVQSGIGHAVVQMKKVNVVTEEQEKSLLDTVSTFDEISEAVSNISDRVKIVSKATRELSDNAKQVGCEISDVASISEESAAATEEVSASAEEQASVIQGISEAAMDLSKLAEKLHSSINKFIL